MAFAVTFVGCIIINSHYGKEQHDSSNYPPFVLHWLKTVSVLEKHEDDQIIFGWTIPIRADISFKYKLFVRKVV